jgi:hypothetical protein
MNRTEFVGAEETENVDQEIRCGLSFYFFLVSWDGMSLSPFGTSASN